MGLRSTLFTIIDEESTAKIALWALRMIPIKYEVQEHPHQQMFSPKGPFFTSLPKIFSGLTHSSIRDTYVENDQLDGFHISLASVEHFSAYKCLGPGLKSVRLRIPCHPVDMELSRDCKDLKTLKLSFARVSSESNHAGELVSKNGQKFRVAGLILPTFSCLDIRYLG